MEGGAGFVEEEAAWTHGWWLSSALKGGALKGGDWCLRVAAWRDQWWLLVFQTWQCGFCIFESVVLYGLDWKWVWGVRVAVTGYWFCFEGNRVLSFRALHWEEWCDYRFCGFCGEIWVLCFWAEMAWLVVIAKILWDMLRVLMIVGCLLVGVGLGWSDVVLGCWKGVIELSSDTKLM